MTKTEADKICAFIEWHYDSVGQEDWFKFCDLLLDMILKYGNSKGWMEDIAHKHPCFFEPASA